MKWGRGDIHQNDPLGLPSFDDIEGPNYRIADVTVKRREPWPTIKI